MRSCILSPAGEMVPIPNCGDEIHWTLIYSRIVAVPKLALRISRLSGVIRKCCRNRVGSQFCTNGDVYSFSTKLNFMDEVLFSCFLKKEILWRLFFK